MQNLLTAEEMRNTDSATINEIGIPGIVLMENAGSGIVRTMEREIKNLKQKKILVVCGKGNNGGDGFVIARHLYLKGINVQIVLLGNIKNLKGDARTNAEIADKLDIPLLQMGSSVSKQLSHGLRHSHIIVDAIFGTGLKRKIEGTPSTVIRQLNSSGKFIVSVDIPSGIDSDSGQATGPHIEASLTCALASFKRSHFLFPAAEAMGNLELVDIGIPSGVINKINETVCLVEKEDIAPCFPKRKRNTHKGTYGHLLILAGSKGKGGAAALTGLAGIRAGTGLVTLACPQSMVPSQEWHPMEVMSQPLPETRSGAIGEEALELILNSLDGKSALAIGPGLGTAPTTGKLLEGLLREVTCPMIIDADGLNLLAKSKVMQRHLPPNTILTPHPKEMSRLTGLSTAKIQKNRLDVVQKYCTRNRVIVVLKGANSLIGLPDGQVRINPTGNAGMATGGSGDVLTGLIGGFLAQGISPVDAAQAGVFLHGYAGDLYVATRPEQTLIAEDLITHLPTAIKETLG